MSQIIEYLNFPFVRYMLIVVSLVSLCSALVGVVLVLKKYSYMGDGLSHVAFGAYAVAAVLGFTNNLFVILPITILSAIIMLGAGRKKRVQGDAIIALVSVSCLAIGYLLMNVFPSTNSISGDVCTTLFGSTALLTLSKTDVIISIVLSVIVILFYILFYNKIFSITFDSDFAKATGINTTIYEVVFSVIIAVIIVIGMKLVGSLLISALIVFPVLASMKVFKSFKGVVISSAIFSIFFALIGVFISMVFDTPVGATIVCGDILGLLLYYFIGIFLK